MNQTLETHLIGDLVEFGIDSNNYERFFDARIARISELLSRLLIEQETENQIQVDESVPTEMEMIEDDL